MLDHINIKLVEDGNLCFELENYSLFFYIDGFTKLNIPDYELIHKNDNPLKLQFQNNI